MENTLDEPTQETQIPALPEETPGRAPDESPHVSPLRRYYEVYGLLIALLVLTVVIGQVPIGGIGVALALLIAISKAGLVLIYFMHLRDSTRLTWLFAAAGLVWLVILVGFILVDYLTRGWIGQ